MTQQFPEGYYKKVLYGGMNRDIPTKIKYFRENQEELRNREKVIGIYKIDQKTTLPSGYVQNRKYTTYEELRRNYENGLKNDSTFNEYTFEKPK